MNITKYVENHVLFNPMKEYLMLLGMDVKDFLPKILNNDSAEIKKIMAPIIEYGLLHILIPLNELLPDFLDDDQLAWWDKEILIVQNRDRWRIIENTFHEIAQTYADENNILEEPYAQSFRASFAETEQMAWNSYANMYSEIMVDHPNAWGLIIPCLYNKHIDEQCFSSLNHYVFPALKKVYTRSDLSSLHIAAIKLGIALISQEIGWRYNGVFSALIANKISNLPEKQLSSMKSDEFRQLLFSNNNSYIVDCVTREWVDNLKLLSNLVNKYSLTGYSSNLITQMLPILLQCIDANEEAIDYLMEIMSEQDAYGRSSSKQLIALYRAVAKERYDSHSKLLDYMELVWGNKKISPITIELLNDIRQTFDSIAEDIRKRFDVQELQVLLQNAVDMDYVFYHKYLNSDSEYLKDIKWVYKEYFESNKIHEAFSALLSIIASNDSGIKYSLKLKCIREYFYLFSCLVAHLDTVPRIAAYSCNELLRVSSDNNSLHEIFNVYTRRQLSSLLDLQKRIDKEITKLPNYDIVAVFENIMFSTNSDYVNLKAYMDSMFSAMTARIEQTEKAVKYYERISEYVLAYAKLDDDLNTSIMKTLVNNSEITMQFCDEIYSLCSQKDVPDTTKKRLESLGALLEVAISHPEKHYSALTKEYLLDSLKEAIDQIPGSGMVKCLYYLGKALGCVLDNAE